MAQEIEVPGMGIVEFPDGMTDAEIAAAIQKSQPGGAPFDAPPEALKTEMPKYTAVDLFEGKRADETAVRMREMEEARKRLKIDYLYGDAQERLAKEQGWGKAGMMSIGKEMSDLGTGIKQLGLNIGDRAVPSAGLWDKSWALQQEHEREKELWEPMREEYPVSTFAGPGALYTAPGIMASRGIQAGTNLLTKHHPIAQEVMKNPFVQGKLAGALEGGVVGSIHPDMNTFVGMGAGGLGGWIGGFMGRPLGKLQDELTPEMRRTVATAKDWNMILMPGAKTNIPYFQKLDAGLKGHPKLSENIRRVTNYNDDIITQRTLREAGINRPLGTEVGEAKPTSELLMDNRVKFRQDYKDLMAKSEGKLSPDLMAAWNKEAEDIARVSGIAPRKPKIDPETGAEIPQAPRTDRTIQYYINRLNEMAGATEGGKISGRDYQQLYSDMSDFINAYSGPGVTGKDRMRADALRNMRGALEEEIGKHIPKDLKAQWKDTRKKYAVTRFLLDNKVIKTDSGQIDPVRLESALVSSPNRDAYYSMDKTHPFYELFKAARVGSYLKRQPGADLRTPQAISRTFGTGMSKTMPGLLFRGGARIPLLSEPMLAGYRAGYPHITGLLGLPATAQRYGQGLGIGAALPEAEVPEIE